MTTAGRAASGRSRPSPWSTLRELLLELYVNARSPALPARVLVIESDDWGATRVPDRASIKRLEAAGVDMSRNQYDRVDSLESAGDLERLVEVLGRHHDAERVGAKITLNTVMGNPDFAATKETGFESYVHELLWSSYERYGRGDAEAVWRAGIDEGCLVPQFHAREHLNVDLWMRDLRAGHEQTRAAFELGYYGHTTRTASRVQPNYLAAYWVESDKDLSAIRRVIAEGLEQFRAAFGVRSRTFVPCKFIFPDALEPMLAARGVMHVQTQRAHLAPTPDGQRRIRRRHTGQRNRWGMTYGVRTVKFEPFEEEGRDWVGTSLRSISYAFAQRRPAIISSHRANYTSGVDVENRDRSLSLLDALLNEVTRRWPDVRFLSSPELAATLHGQASGLA